MLQQAPRTVLAEGVTPGVPLFEANGLVKAFGGRPALHDISFSIAPGEIVGFVGPNGAGKSTTLRIACGLLRPGAGSVRLDGFCVRQSPRDYLGRLGALIESPGYWPALSASHHLAYLARARGGTAVGRIEEALTEVGLDPTSRKPVGQFSLGMKQRLGIAMALLHRPRLLVLDEPMNGLDPAGMAMLREFLRGLGGERGVSVLVSSHLLHEVEQICDRVLFIREGRLLPEAPFGHARVGGVEAVFVRTDDDARAAQVLGGEDFVREVAEGTDGLTCRVAAADVPRVAEALHRSGLALHELTPRRASLEDLYIERFGRGTEEGLS
jgi:ABC-type multidrug transport system ATPase subunit